MADNVYPKSQLPIRRSVEFLPTVFQTEANDKFLSGVFDPLIQPGTLEKTVGYVGRRYGKTYNGSDVYLDTDETLRSRYQLEPGVLFRQNGVTHDFYDFLDLKNILKFFGSTEERDHLTDYQQHYSWKPPIDWDKFLNYREYYWVPSGPPAIKILGQAVGITSTYRVKLGVGSTYIFSPDGYSNNPTLTLYRGQVYKFIMNAPGSGMVIKTSYDKGSLTFYPDRDYAAGELAIFNSALWRAKVPVSSADGSTIDIDSQDWEFVEAATVSTILDYTKGVKNNGIENGTLTFEVPYDAPDVLFYQSNTDPNRFGRFVIADIENATSINIDKEVLGKANYTSGNGIAFSNSMVVKFEGAVTPEKYASGSWLIEGVGDKITLTNFDDLVVPKIVSDVPEVLFDNDGFDTIPFDDASAYPAYKDYITIAKSSKDLNPWSRYNRWFHRSILEQSHKLSGSDFSAVETTRAKRPIIEFVSNLKLFQFGAIAKTTVDYIDTYTTDVFSKIEGSSGYSIDGEPVFDGARILVVADTDSLANNKIYQVEFITQNANRQITLKAVNDTDSILGETVLIRRGKINQGKMFYYNGSDWKLGQEKTKVNQPPMFDSFDEQGISFGDIDKYPVSTFAGTKIVSYKIGSGVADTELGFPLSYLNLDNVGDIEFNFDWDTQTVTYEIDRESYSVDISTGFFKFNDTGEFGNNWVETNNTYLQPIIDSVIVENPTNTVSFTTLNWQDITDDMSVEIYFYLNGKKLTSAWEQVAGTFTFSHTFSAKDVLVIKIFSDLVPNTGYYEVPVGLEKNPLNEILTTFTFGQATDHVSTGIEFSTEFSGVFPGASNLRDLVGYQNHNKRFLKHSSLAPASIALLVDKKLNIVKSIKYAKKAYSEFKNNFLKLSGEFEYNDDVPSTVDNILSALSKTKTSISPFNDSDMVGTGAYSVIEYTVEDVGIKTFSLSQHFDLKTQSTRAVYVYINGRQLINSKDYQFNESFPFVQLNVSLVEGDEIRIVEYGSTAFNHIPPTPTKLGIYKKYLPYKFLDDTYLEPRWMIQGHDGSLVPAFEDYRDDILLELELRIYNNLKEPYTESLFDIDRVLGGYYKSGIFSKSQVDEIISTEFLTWISDTTVDYTSNRYFDSENSFTYTYSNMLDPTSTQVLPGWWRGVYQWFFDTTRPHMCPWEMLGFSEKPTWWESEYGPAPYTSNNLILWEDLANGVIRQGPTAGVDSRYQRPGLLECIPVDANGKLISPLDSNLARGFSLINNQGDFKFGDSSPAEYAWRITSEYPFAVVIALCLLRPFEFIGQTFDRATIKRNILNQLVSSTTNKFINVDNLVLSATGGSKVSGLASYIVDFLLSQSLPSTQLQTRLESIDVGLTYRLSGFVDPQQQKFVLDSRSPNSTSSNIFIPFENQEIFFNVSAPINSITYSGVIIEKLENGWKLEGYDKQFPYFPYFFAISSVGNPTISVGGISENYLQWSPNKFYGNGVIIEYSNRYYRSLASHDSGSTFDITRWKLLPGLPKIGSTDAFKKSSFDYQSVLKMSYGTVLGTVQEVVDFLIGYEQYLISQGFKFGRYDSENKVTQDWTTSAKEFMYWTQHNWAVGSLLTLSPSAEKLDIDFSVGVLDNLLDSFYDYQVYRGDGNPLVPNFLNIKRGFQNVTIETTNTNEGIYFFKGYLVLKEHVAIFSDRTVFNDVIYDKTTGYRQERIKSRGFRTVDWDGDYTSPGFLFDNVSIAPWQPFVDYKLGDIVSYKAYNWVSQINQTGAEFFNDSHWSKLDSLPEKRLVPNFDYRINQFEDYYNLDSDGLSTSQRDLGRHAIAYQTRDYLQNLAEDDVTQFQLYQGFIREKGTKNAAVKIFDKISRSTEDSIVLNEEWAFNVGEFGGKDQLKEIEFAITRNDIQINPQPILIVTSIPSSVILDQYLRIPASQFTKADTPFTVNIIPTTTDVELQTAGYVKFDQIDYAVATIDDISNIDITSVADNDHIWVTFYKHSWTVFRVNIKPLLHITAISKVIKPTSTVEITFDRRHTFAVDDVIGIVDVTNLTGFFKIVSVSTYTISVQVSKTAIDPVADLSTLIKIYGLTESRFARASALSPDSAALLSAGAKLWIDQDDTGKWQVLEKNNVFLPKEITDYGTTIPLNAGSSVVYVENLRQTITGLPTRNLVVALVEGVTGLGSKQVISPDLTLYPLSNSSFGASVAVSPDNRWLVIGTPFASNIPTRFKGALDAVTNYNVGDIVLYAGKLWQAVTDKHGDSTIDITNGDWVPATIIDYDPVLGTGQNLYKQGLISIYQWANQTWNIYSSFVSPRPATGELFGSSIAIGKSGTEYYMTVSAPGSLDNTGRVYIYKFNGTQWAQNEDSNYRGIFDAHKRYPTGSIVWYDNRFWQATVDFVGDGSTIGVDEDATGAWTKIDPVPTQPDLPTHLAVNTDGSSLIDGSTLTEGPTGSTTLAELVKQDDAFGSSMALSRDGSILVIGSPNSDGVYFENYKGMYSPYIEYTKDDVVKVAGVYRKLTSDFSIAEDPAGLPWISVGDSSFYATGKVYIYQKDQYSIYRLKQTITSQSIANFSDLDKSEPINVGDQFGFSVDIDATGLNIVISSPLADINLQNQGSVYFFSAASLAAPEWRLKQKIESYEEYSNILFGFSVSISPGADRVVVGAKNAPYKASTYFMDNTTFDRNSTTFSEDKGYTGQVYSYERLDGKYFLAEKLQADLQTDESFGYSIDVSTSVIAVGSPAYKELGVPVGTVRLFKKANDVNSLGIIAQQDAVTDIEKIKNIILVDTVKNIKIADVDFIDHARLKILGIADAEINYKTPYDPATYTIGSDEQVVDSTTAWFEKQVGKIWWNLGTAKWVDYEQGDISYRTGNWNKLAQGASIDVYEWVETILQPSEWSALADTATGLANGISGQPLHPNNDVYSVKQLYNSATQQLTKTLYYYWVKASTIIPTDMPNRSLSAAGIQSLISNPAGSGLPIIAVLDSNKLLAYNFNSAITSENASVNIEFYRDSAVTNPVHREYLLMSENVADSVPNETLEQKWIDSLIGFDQAGNTIPDPKLSDKEKYGLSFRPRQSMFKDKAKILKIIIDNINGFLTSIPAADLIDFEYLKLADPLPSEKLNEYDIAVDTLVDLEQIGTIRVRQAVFHANIVNGEIDTIDIIDAGFGYKKAPYIQIEGTGKGATASITIDLQGRVDSIKILSRGKKYSSAIVKIRAYSVLVRQDKNLNNFWGIYSWDQDRQLFYRSKSQGYDTTKYWEYIDWWAEGYSASSRIIFEIPALYLEPTLSTKEGDLIKVKEFGTGGWAVLLRTADGQGEILKNYLMIGRENGTIYAKDSLFNKITTPIGFDNVAYYDAALYDLEPSTELRNILKAVKQNINIYGNGAGWNNLFFTSIRYAFSEQENLYWAFKTSFVNAVHNVGPLEQRVTFKNDNLPAYQKYLEEIKPYKTTIREYTSRYTNLDNTESTAIDFDLPPIYSAREGRIVPIDGAYNLLDQYPWKFWAEELGYAVVDIKIADAGAEYTSVPQIRIEGNGTGATAKAYISNGKVSGIKVTNSGKGYTLSPRVYVIGGNGSSTQIAKAVAILGETKARMFNVGMKFDRLTKTGLYKNFKHTQTLVASGRTSVFELHFAPTIDKNKISITKNNQLVLNSEYDISLYRLDTDAYQQLRGKIIFAQAPLGADPTIGRSADVIEITYEKNDELLDAVNRIHKYYAPSEGMAGEDLGQLMTGVDFGGVQVQGNTFEVTGGWDALPWFTDSWDSVESNNDVYIQVDGSTTTVTLPTPPAPNERISVYLQRAGNTKAMRIDDPHFNIAGDSAMVINPNALMPTIIGDGSTVTYAIDEYFNTYPGDTLIFRAFDSDGSVVINDPNLLDTNITGGTLAQMSGAYITATGKTAEELLVDGGKFIDPNQVPAPEENVPGQVLDTLSIKVFQTTVSGAAPLQNYVLTSDGVTNSYDIGITVPDDNSILVYVDKVLYEKTTNYFINYVTNKVVFNTIPATGSLIEIIAVGRGGINLLDYQEFVADGQTHLFLTKSLYSATQSVFVSVDGIEVDTGFRNSTVVSEETGAAIAPDYAIIDFAMTPDANQVIKIIALGTSANTDSSGLSLIRVNKQTIKHDGSTRSYELDRFIDLDRNSATSSMIVLLNNKKLKGPDTYYRIYDGSNNEIIVGQDPKANVTSVDVKVYINGIAQPFVTAYVFDGTTNKVIVNTAFLELQDVIKVEILNDAEYSVANNNIIIDATVALVVNDTLDITWFGEYPTFDIVSDVYTGGKVNYQLARQPLDLSYVWVYQNGTRLVSGRDYTVIVPRNIVYLNVPSTLNDRVEIVQFGNQIYKDPRAFEIHKDMLNITHYTRFAITKAVLTKDLRYYDTEIEVSDASNLAEPIRNRNIPGTVTIDNEKIEYMVKEGNVLKQLRRGCLGTAISELARAGTKVVSSGKEDTIPYIDTQEKESFVSDGSTLLIGPLPYVPVLSSRNDSFARVTIPNEYGPCDQLEIFVGGRRLLKDHLRVYDETLGASSPTADTVIEAEFTVDGTTPYVRLTKPVKEGLQVLIIRKVGRVWYDRAETTASKGITLLNNETAIAKFIDQKASELPE